MQQVPHAEFVNEGCDNATTSALYAGWAAQGIRAQFDALNGQEDVVFLSIGINNSGFGEIAENCLINLAQTDPNRCTSRYVVGGQNTLPEIAAGISTSTTLPSVGSAIDQIHARSPSAKVFLVGYPLITPLDGVGCKPNYFNLSVTDGPVFGAWEIALNDTLRNVAAGHNAYFVDLVPATASHNACLPAGVRWTVPFSQFDPTAVGEGVAFHTNLTGANAVANIVLQAMTDAGIDLEPTDSTPPTVAINAPTPNQVFNVNAATLTYTASDNVGISSCTRPNNSQVALALGVNTISVSCSDSSGNSTSASVTVTYSDTTAPAPPTVTRANPIATPTKSTSQTISYTGAEAGGTFRCKLDAAAYAPCSSSPFTLTGLGNGMHTLAVTQTDAANNVGSATAVTWVVDITPPLAPIVTRITPTTNPTKSTSQSIAYSGEAGGSFQCKLDTAAYAPCPSSPLTLTGLASGPHTLLVTQTDAVGNLGPAGAVSWTIDIIPPPAPSVSGPSGTTALNTASIAYSDSESGVTFQCKLDSAPFAPCASNPVSLTGLSNGAHTFYVTATDPAGNVSTAGTATWTVDPTGFTVSIASGPNNPTNQSTATFSFVGTLTSNVTYQCKLDAAPFADCTSPKNYAGLADGSHTFTVHATNNVSSQVTSDASRTWIVDSTPPGLPTVTRTSPTANPTNQTSQTIAFAGAEGGGTLNCKLDSASFETCPTSPVTLNGLGIGTHTFSVTQTDVAGNTGSATTIAWTIHITPPPAPTVVRTAPTADVTKSTSQTISYGGEAGSTFQCKLDAAAPGPCPVSPVTLGALSEGTHTYSVTQTDAAGNLSAAGSVSWTTDYTAPAPPTVTRTSPTANPTTSTTQWITYTGAEPGGTFKCKLDGASYEICPSSPLTAAGLTIGSHSYSVTETDSVGNTSAPGAVSWTVESPSPPPPDPGPNATPPPATLPPTFDLAVPTAVSAKLSAVRPRTIVPHRVGGTFSLRQRSTHGALSVSLSKASTVFLRLERVRAGRRRASSGWRKLKLKAGRTRIYLSGRVNGRALAAGRYRVRLTLRDGSRDRYGRIFRVKR